MDTALGPREKIVSGIDLARDRGLEIGALYNPRLRKDEANVWYLDHATTDELRSKYAGNPDAGPHLDELVDVDFVCRPPATIAEAVGSAAPFDFVIASHVIEHIPDMVGWLREVEEVLVPNGVLKLVVPDKRYCFDVKRPLTTMADLVDAHLRRLSAPSYRQMYDMAANFLPVDVAELWDGADVSSRQRPDCDDPDVFALEFCLAQMRTGAYEDVHCSTFTPSSFSELIGKLRVLRLTGFELAEVHPTPQGHHEFFATLKRTGASIRGIPEPATPTGHIRMPVSPLERRALEVKRSVMGRLRSFRR